jgi:hypothetical protein
MQWFATHKNNTQIVRGENAEKIKKRAKSVNAIK